MKKYPIAIIGLGIGAHHLAAYRQFPDRFEVKAVCSLEPEISKKIAAENNIPRICTSLDEVCDLSDIDIVDLCTPPYLHFQQLNQVLHAGKDAICEKPLVGSLAEIDQLIALEKSTGKTIMPILNYRFGNGVRRLKKLIDAGITGKAYLATVEIAWRRKMDYYSVPWRGRYETELGGTLMSHGIHGLDLLLYVLGGVKSLHAYAATRVNPIQVEDCLAVSMEMADGSLATFADTTGSPDQITRHRFCFANLVAESNTMPYKNSSDPWKFTADDQEIETRIQSEMENYVPGLEDFAGQFQAYAQARQNKQPLPVTLQDARNTLEVITAIYYSAHTGKHVELPILSDHPYYNGWYPKT